jgi:hypothetical protein
MTNVVDVLLAGLDEAYEKKGWHGTNLRGSLRRVTPEEALWRPAPERHNIWELALHAAYWKYAVRRRLVGVKRGSFERKGSNWFRSPDIAGEDEWDEIVDLLGREHRLLRDAVARVSRKQLEDRKKLQLIYGITAHDLYHTGQIQLIKRLYRDSDNP